MGARPMLPSPGDKLTHHASIACFSRAVNSVQTRLKPRLLMVHLPISAWTNAIVDSDLGATQSRSKLLHVCLLFLVAELSYRILTDVDCHRCTRAKLAIR